MPRRAIIVVLDSVGIGRAPDADLYGDTGSNTLANTARAVGGLRLPHLGHLGLGNLTDVPGVPPEATPPGAFGRMEEASVGKDTITGHWEIAGIISARAMPTYPDGFPPEVMDEFERRIGRRTLGNYAASGTVIIQELGEEHLHTGYPIVYTSADSVFQIAAHEEVIPVEELYRMCRIAREILTGEHAVGRVIARPFIGEAAGRFQRTDRRKDFSLPPPYPTLLDRVKEAGQPVYAVGKIHDVFAGRSITEAVHTHDNMDGLDQTLAFMTRTGGGLIFTNLIDFDMLYGHRNNPHGYAKALEAVDQRVPELLEALREEDLLIFTADHGNDPTTPSTDHSREMVPLLVAGPKVRGGLDLGTRETFADLGQSVAEFLGTEPVPAGTSFAGEILSQVRA